jgi:hypothetical protein
MRHPIVLPVAIAPSRKGGEFLMRRIFTTLVMVAVLVIALAAPAPAFIHVRVPGDDCSGFGPENDTATAAIISQIRPGNLPPLGDDGGNDRAPNNFCPAPNK